MKTDVSASTVTRLLAAAKAAAARAYCPYSKFRVGAAVLSGGGNIYAGCNIENASYGLTVCAERNAIYEMVGKGEQVVDAVVIYTPTQVPAAPCGACRQVLYEFGRRADIISICDGPTRLESTLEALLPDAFGPDNVA